MSVRAPLLLELFLASLALAACVEPQYATSDAEARHEGADDDAATLEDAGAASVQSDPSCVDKPSILGAECPNIVLCNNMGPCDQATRICCLTALSADCSARSDCGVEQRARCDGPEDCAPGAICCVSDGATQCSDPAECPESQRACHTDADCATHQCARGWPGTFGGLPVTYFAEWGFCRS